MGELGSQKLSSQNFGSQKFGSRALFVNIEKILLKNMWTILLWTKKIVYINNTSIELEALELQEQSFIPQTSSQEANSRLFLCFHLKTFVRPP